MTDHEKHEGDSAAIDQRIAAIFERAVAETFLRLATISANEREDNVAFDRAARTALAFLRVAEAASMILARKRKDDADHDEGVEAPLPSPEQVAAIQRQLDLRLARSARGQVGARTAPHTDEHESRRD